MYGQVPISTASMFFAASSCSQSAYACGIESSAAARLLESSERFATATISTFGILRSPGTCTELTMPPAPMIPTRILAPLAGVDDFRSCADSTLGARAAATGSTAADRTSRRLILGLERSSAEWLMDAPAAAIVTGEPARFANGVHRITRRDPWNFAPFGAYSGSSASRDQRAEKNNDRAPSRRSNPDFIDRVLGLALLARRRGVRHRRRARRPAARRRGARGQDGHERRRTAPHPARALQSWNLHAARRGLRAQRRFAPAALRQSRVD